MVPPPASTSLNVATADDDQRRQALLDVLQNQTITSVLQPIVSLRDGAVFGYEALGRGPAGTPLEGPEALIQCALENGRMSAASRAVAGLSAQAQNLEGLIEQMQNC